MKTLHIDDCSSFFNYIKFEKRYSEHTLVSYKNDIGQFVQYCDTVYEIDLWKKISHQHVRSWIIQLMENGIGPRSIRRKISALRSLFLYLLKKAEVEVNPMLKVNVPKISKTLPVVIQKEKVVKLFDTIGENEYVELRNRLILEMFYLTGMRRAELVNLKDRDIDFSNQQVKVLGKGNKERNIPLSVEIIKKLDGMIRLRNEEFSGKQIDDYLFVTDKGKQLYPKWVYNMVKEYLSTITAQEKRSPHILRHSFATHLLDAGAELNAIKELLGHANLAATQVYTHNSIEKLKEVYKFAHPKSV